MNPLPPSQGAVTDRSKVGPVSPGEEVYPVAEPDSVSSVCRGPESGGGVISGATTNDLPGFGS